jgi:hypothetical protein
MGHLLKRKCSHSPLNLRILSSTSVPFTLTTMQVLNLALTHKKRITVQCGVLVRSSIYDIMFDLLDMHSSFLDGGGSLRKSVSVLAGREKNHVLVSQRCKGYRQR